MMPLKQLKLLTNIHLTGKFYLTSKKYVQLAGRPFLLGSQGKGFPSFLNGQKESYPFIIYANENSVKDTTSPEDCAHLLKTNYRNLLTKYGAVLLRGFPLGDAHRLHTFLCNLGENIKPMTYQSGVAVRQNLGGMVYTSSDESSEISMEAHNEMSYTPKWPSIVVFACAVPAGEGCGGETVLVDSRELYKAIDRDVFNSFHDKGGVRYYHHYKENDSDTGYSWKKCFETTDKQDVIDFLVKKDIEHYFDRDNSLTYWVVRPATIKHHITGESVWFNQASSMHGSYLTVTKPEIWAKGNLGYDQMPFHTYYGDGTEIPEDYIQHLRNVSWSSAVGFQLKKNDVLLLDNELIQHGRMSFTGQRKLLAALIDER